MMEKAIAVTSLQNLTQELSCSCRLSRWYEMDGMTTVTIGLLASGNAAIKVGKGSWVNGILGRPPPAVDFYSNLDAGMAKIAYHTPPSLLLVGEQPINRLATKGVLNISLDPSHLRRRAQLLVGNGRCEDTPDNQATGFRVPKLVNGVSQMVPARCSMLILECDHTQHGCTISGACPVTCGACNDCDQANTYMSLNGQPATCEMLAVYCNHAAYGDSIRTRCPASCGCSVCPPSPPPPRSPSPSSPPLSPPKFPPPDHPHHWDPPPPSPAAPPRPPLGPPPEPPDPSPSPPPPRVCEDFAPENTGVLSPIDHVTPASCELIMQMYGGWASACKDCHVRSVCQVSCASCHVCDHAATGIMCAEAWVMGRSDSGVPWAMGGARTVAFACACVCLVMAGLGFGCALVAAYPSPAVILHPSPRLQSCPTPSTCTQREATCTELKE